MNVTMVVASLSRSAGGIFEISRRMSQELARLADTRVAAVGLLDRYTLDDAADWSPIRTLPCPTLGPARLGWAPGFGRAIDSTNPDIIHQHGIWRLSSVGTYRWARRTGRPYVIEVHGMLSQWALNNSAWKKRLALAVFQRRQLEAAACLIVNTVEEARAVRDFGLTNPIAIIPNGVDIPNERTPRSPYRDAIGPDRKAILFLGRIHPKKGLRELLMAWSKIVQGRKHADTWSLVITGWDDGGHEAGLRRLAKRHGLAAPDLHFTGPLFGSDKQAALADAAAFILPSFSEGLPMAVLEALAARLPVLMTSACNLPEAFDCGAALEIEPDGSSIRRGIDTLLEMSPEQVQRMGDRGRQLVNERFTWPSVALRVHRVYAWLLGDQRPDELMFDG